jgi:AraC-like DNA-binding protein
MVEQFCAMVATTASTTTSFTGGTTLQWNASNGECRAVMARAGVERSQPSPFFVKTSRHLAPRAERYWTSDEICVVPMVPPQVIAWDQEAARITFYLAPRLLTTTTHEPNLGATSELVWVHDPHAPISISRTVRPVLLVHAGDRTQQADLVEIIPNLQAHDPLRHHMTLALQATMEEQSPRGCLYAESLAEALGSHFLKRYTIAQPSHGEVTGGLSPYKLRHTTTYIKEHLAEELSLVTLAAVGQTSPAHFARQFKHSTGLTPHQYVIDCRMEQAKQLLTATEASLSEIGLQVGCADQSHFSALFRKYAFMTPKAYRDHTKR